MGWVWWEVVEVVEVVRSLSMTKFIGMAAEKPTQQKGNNKSTHEVREAGVLTSEDPSAACRVT